MRRRLGILPRSTGSEPDIWNNGKIYIYINQDMIKNTQEKRIKKGNEKKETKKRKKARMKEEKNK